MIANDGWIALKDERPLIGEKIWAKKKDGSLVRVGLAYGPEQGILAYHWLNFDEDWRYNGDESLDDVVCWKRRPLS